MAGENESKILFTTNKANNSPAYVMWIAGKLIYGLYGFMLNTIFADFHTSYETFELKSYS